jgi:hypothetical protein
VGPRRIPRLLTTYHAERLNFGEVVHTMMQLPRGRVPVEYLVLT